LGILSRWAIDNSAYGTASIAYEKFLDWWRAYPPGLLVLHWDQRTGGAIGNGLFLTVLRHA
jgi:hypothetical protein